MTAFPASRSARVDVRRVIHIGASLVAITLVALLPKPVAVLALGVAVLCAGLVELVRRVGWGRARFLSLAGPLLKPAERDRICGATWLSVSYFLAVLFFPRPVALTAMLYGGLGDPAATFTGRRWGRSAPGRKSWQGFAGGLLINCLAGLLIPGIILPAALAGALTASLAEFLPLPLDDNLRTTLAGGVVLRVLPPVLLMMG
ncbi:MAG: hypothetical protein LBG44_02390 [Gemmatimonadota bacterium]|jgi:dolichol kinase|nr:hypothetical protein [Gemmatimonadota bacterium]